MKKSKFTLRLDTGKEGILAVFKRWQYDAINLLLEAHEEHSSNEIHMRLRARGHDISRASVINFLHGLSVANLATKKEVSSKGGYKGIYQIAETEQDFNARVVDIFIVKLLDAFPAFRFITAESINQ